MGGAFIIGLLALGLVAFAMTLIPPARIGGLAKLMRYAAAGFLCAMGLLLMSRGNVLAGLVLAGAGVYVVARRHLRIVRGASQSGPANDTSRPPYGPSSGMSEKEAYEVLGLAPGATEEDIRRAHHHLMQKIHPDQGGSNYLAQKLNAARDTLLKSGR